MKQLMVTIQGQRFCSDIGLIEQLLAENPGWGRSRLSVRLCELWDWRAANGQLKAMACRNLLMENKSGRLFNQWVATAKERLRVILRCCGRRRLNNHQLKAGGLKIGGLNRRLKENAAESRWFETTGQAPFGRAKAAW